VTLAVVQFNTTEGGTMRSRTIVALAATALGLVLAGAAQAGTVSTWTTALKIDEIPGNSSELNTPDMDGCPIQSPDGLSLYLASNRPGGKGLLDIWVARRASKHAPWGAPENLGEPVNSAADDFCPTPIGHGGLFFVSREALPGSCGLGDIYFTRYRHGTWSEPEHLACAPVGPNTALDEQGPSYVRHGRHGQLYYSSGTAVVPGDVYAAAGTPRRGFGPGFPVAELNDPAANDVQPNVRKDGLEVVLSSNRAGTLGAQDVWIATRRRICDPWSAPRNIGPGVNTGASETRPSLSRKGDQLLFGRAPGPEGGNDVYVSTRVEDKHPHH
jgi:hypothetical protein